VDGEFVRHRLELRPAFSWPQLDLKNAARRLDKKADRCNGHQNAH
jgi:hypothetical protein